MGSDVYTFDTLIVLNTILDHVITLYIYLVHLCLLSLKRFDKSCQVCLLLLFMVCQDLKALCSCAFLLPFTDLFRS